MNACTGLLRLLRDRAVPLAVAVGVAGGLAPLVRTPDPAVTSAVTTTLVTLAASLAAWHRRPRRRPRAQGPGSCSRGTTLWFAGGLVWDAYALDGRLADPLVAGVVFAVGGASSLVGLVNLPSAPDALWPRLRMLLDAAIAALCLVFIAWPALLEPRLASSSTSYGDVALALVFPLADLVAVAFVLAMASHGGGRRATLLWLVASVGIRSVSDIAYGIERLADRYVVGDRTVDIAFLATFVFLALAANAARSERGDATARLRGATRLETLLPFAPIALAVASAGVDLLHGHGVTGARLCIALVVVALLTARQVVAAWENAALTERLRHDATHDHLPARRRRAARAGLPVPAPPRAAGRRRLHARASGRRRLTADGRRRRRLRTRRACGAGRSRTRRRRGSQRRAGPRPARA